MQEKMRFTTHLRRCTIERLKNAVYWTAGCTITSLVDDCISYHLDAMEYERKSKFLNREKPLNKGKVK